MGVDVCAIVWMLLVMVVVVLSCVCDSSDAAGAVVCVRQQPTQLYVRGACSSTAPAPPRLHAHTFAARYRNIQPKVCRVNAGDVIYVPSHWWHEVRSLPDTEGKTVAINYFFEPWYERYGHKDSSPAFIRNKLYDHLAPGDRGGADIAKPCRSPEMCFAN